MIMHIIFDQFVFFLTLLWLFFIPGIAFLSILKGKKTFSLLEYAVAGFGIGVVLLDITLIVADKVFHLAITRTLILLVPFVVLVPLIAAKILTNFSICNIKKIQHITSHITNRLATKNITRRAIRSHQKTYIALILIALTITIKTFYLADTLFPTATDMGHHLYWVNKIATTHHLHVYEKQKIITKDDGTYAISAPENIADFIIGEHIPLAAISIVTGKNVLSSQPILFLFLLDLFSVLALFMFAVRLFAHTHIADTIGISVLFLMGPLYTISASQAKFVAGGVIGNLFGNLFIPLAFFFLYRALTEKSACLLSAFFIIVTGLIYTHHLSTFIFLYSIAFVVFLFILLNIRTVTHFFREWINLLLHPLSLFSLISTIILLLFVYTPHYLNPDAISSATGAPSKETRTGVTLVQLMHTIGEARFTFAVIGSIILTLYIVTHHFPLRHKMRVCITQILYEKIWHKVSPKNAYAVAIIIAWPLATFAMSTIPQYLGINIISSRIANYTIIPFALIGGIGLAWLIATARTYLAPFFAITTGITIILFAITTGMYDNSQSLKTTPSLAQARESFAAARYVASHTAKDEWTLKDHNYLTADTWMKLFFLRDYSYPLSRSYFKRYESGTRETCTRDMISAPLSTHAQHCFNDLSVRYIIVSPQHDAAQFMTSDQFYRIYSSKHVTVFYRH